MIVGLWTNSMINWFSLNIIGGINSEKWYSFIILIVFSELLFTRCPYIYNYTWFILLLFASIIPLYISLVLTRLYVSLYKFFAEMVPNGSPSWILPFIPHIEIISFIIRPIVLLLRPFINISVGIYAGLTIGDLCILFNNYIFIFFLFAFFIYEVFVIVVHWFIINEILKFTIFH
uniref:ATP synthase F0 subunit 6 n=1 Tax=Schistosoma haematobium TaxID=6185 RepID=A0A516EZY7_SCHHA|nr:ATP synthase F0 subunit 6 [Schistosoma haematobium]